MNNIHDGIMPTMLSIETPFNSCVYIEDVNRGILISFIFYRNMFVANMEKH